MLQLLVRSPSRGPRAERSAEAVKRIGRAILVLAAFVAPHGCGVQDSSQPAIGSISIESKSKANDEWPPVVKKAAKPDRKLR
jgi:hypothetical protein